MLPSMNSLTSSIIGLLLPLIAETIGGKNNAYVHMRVMKLLYDAIGWMGGKAIYGNWLLPEQCTQYITNYMGVKIFGRPITTMVVGPPSQLLLLPSVIAARALHPAKFLMAVNAGEPFPMFILVNGGYK